jgi:tetratricopeptide (TPR) repeat protein
MKTILKNFLTPAVAAAALLLPGGCELDRFPYNEISADNLDATNIENITLGNYAKLKEEYYYKTLHQLGEYGGDNVTLSGTTSDNLFKHYTFRREKDNHYTANVWKFTYQMVVNINATLENVPEGESAEKDYLLGENYFLRGFLYFQLCNIFGRPYTQNPETNPGIPLKLTTRIDEFPPRASVAEVYKQIIQDFKKAEKLMETEKSKENIFASKEVAQAFLSRVYLYMEKWDEAIDYATKVIESKRYKLLQGAEYQNYAGKVPEDNTETIFAIRMVKDVDFRRYVMGEYSVGALYAKIHNTGWGEMYPSATYLDLLDENLEDLRHGFIVPETEEGTLRLSYVREENDDIVNVTDSLKQVAENKYFILENHGHGRYKNDTVQTDIDEKGNIRYFVERTDDGKKYPVRVENIALRNGYPMRYIYKVSMQEGQSHLYSPVMIRLGEVYLNRAEAYAELKDQNNALNDLNVIRDRAGIPRVTEDSISDRRSLLTWVLNERRLELAWEGHRKYDIFRKGQTMDRKYPGWHLSGEPVYKEVTPDKPFIVEYIPEREMNAYPTPLEQNP